MVAQSGGRRSSRSSRGTQSHGSGRLKILEYKEMKPFFVGRIDIDGL